MNHLEFHVLASRKGEAQLVLNKLQNKAAKLGLPFHFEWAEAPFTKPKSSDSINPATGKPYIIHVTYRLLVIQQEPLKLASWKLLARVEFLEQEAIVQCVPGETVPPEYLKTDDRCEHCFAKRHRKDVFILEHEDGRKIQVGRTCIRDFLGHEPNRFMAVFEIKAVLEEESEGWGSGGTGGWCWSPEELLTDTATVIRLYGWKSKGAAQVESDKYGTDVTPTIGHVNCKDSEDPIKKRWWRDMVEPHQNEGDAKLAAETIEWAKSLEHVTNEYLHNLYVILSKPYIEGWKHRGLAASAIAAYLKQKQRDAELGLRKNLNELSQHQGKLGERLRDIPVKLEMVVEMEANQFGPRAMYKFRHADGHLFVTFTGSAIRMNIGQDCLLTGTVKKHDEFKNTKQTILSRVACLPMEDKQDALKL